MSQPVFISYARGDSASHAQALANVLNGQAFLDTESIDDGDDFPQRLLDALLASRIVVVFASKTYLERRFCRVEMRLALHAGDEKASHIVLASGEDAQAVRDAMPEQVARTNWPPASETPRLADLVRSRLDRQPNPLGSRIPAQEARVVASLFIEEASVPEPRSLQGILVSFPPGLAAQSIGRRFVGRASDLRKLHRILAEGGGGAARLTSRITAGAGSGKTRLAIEYVNRYGPRYYPGGIFWVDAESSVLAEEFWRILRIIDPSTPDITLLRGQKPTIYERLDAALRSIPQPVLYVADNIPEAVPGEDPPPLGSFCPALGAVTVLATSRQDTQESGIENLEIGNLDHDSAVLYLRSDVPSASALSWEEWGVIADWVGNLSVALELLNRALALGSITPRQLLARASAPKVPSATMQLDRFAASLRGQVRTKATAGVTAAFSISYEKLDPATQTVARILAQLAPTPIPNEFLEALPEKLNVFAARAALRSRHFVIPSDAETFGVMHRLTADFLRSLPEEPEFASFESACQMVSEVMTDDRCRDPNWWSLMNLCNPHAGALFVRGVGIDTTAISACDIGFRVEVFASYRGDYSQARQFEERLLEVRKRIQGEENLYTLTAMNNLASTLRAQGDLLGARNLEERALEVRMRILGAEHRETLAAMNNLASTLCAQGDLLGARNLEERALEVRMRILGAEHRDTLISMGNLAETLRIQGDLQEARNLQERALEVSKRVLGAEHTDTLTSMNNLALMLAAQGDFAGARSLEGRVFEARKRILGEKHPDTLRSMNNLAEVLRHQDDLVGARNLQERALEVSKRVLGEEHPDTLNSMNNLAQSLWTQGDLTGARDLEERAFEARKRILGVEHPHTLNSMYNLAITLSRSGDPARALDLIRDCLIGRRKVLGENHPDTILTAEWTEFIENQLRSRPGLLRRIFSR
ncbi:MAG: toll/interleukin-1 receptor domain-containing protein [Silvibacterium sp.]|nr:toll/interleukin-1 receptor domain-containing protein [Silvibacterium sp.]MBV8437813.1 toll/interleukin-1 receptor domain-containing protein [Silvibacterium sp.]